MRKPKFSENQIVVMLAEGDAEQAIEEICRQHGFSYSPIVNGRSNMR
jgi:hypothetical protein